MPTLNFSIPNSLEPSQAKPKLQRHLADTLQKKLGADFTLIDISWIGSTADISCIINGYSLEISLQLKPQKTQIRGTLPLAALPLRKQIEKDLCEISAKILGA